MVYKYECNAMRKGSSFLPHSSVQLSASAESRQQSVCVCRRAQLFFYLGAKERERKVTRLLTWPLIAGTNIHLVSKPFSHGWSESICTIFTTTSG